MSSRFEEFGVPLNFDHTVIPDDDTTLFICSGMQRVRERFLTPDGSVHGSIQSCIRTNDLELVGDGSHLTYFQMIGNFAFGGDYYERAVELWDSILKDLRFPLDPVHVHPDRDDHKNLWLSRGYSVVDDPDCVWSDGRIGGHCCEIYSHGLEIGNLVNTLNHSVDVGFGLERMVQIAENQPRVDKTSLFLDSHPVVADHCRTVEILWKNGISPSPKHRGYITRRLIRRMIPHLGSERFVFDEWVEGEKVLLEKRMKEARRLWKKHRNKPAVWWWETCGILPEELSQVEN